MPQGVHAGGESGRGSAATNLPQPSGSPQHLRVIPVLLIERLGDIGEQGVDGTYVHQLHREGPLLIEEPWGNQSPGGELAGE